MTERKKMKRNPWWTQFMDLLNMSELWTLFCVFCYVKKQDNKKLHFYLLCCGVTFSFLVQHLCPLFLTCNCYHATLDLGQASKFTPQTWDDSVNLVLFAHTCFLWKPWVLWWIIFPPVLIIKQSEFPFILLPVCVSVQSTELKGYCGFAFPVFYFISLLRMFF